MKSWVSGIVRFWRDERAANGVEYSLLAGLIAIAFVVGAGLLGDNINVFLENVAKCVATPDPALCTAPFGA